MIAFFVLTALWLIGWSVLLFRALLNDRRRKAHPYSLLHDFEIEL